MTKLSDSHLRSIASAMKMSEQTAQLWLDHGAPISDPANIEVEKVLGWMDDHPDLVAEEQQRAQRKISFVAHTSVVSHHGHFAINDKTRHLKQHGDLRRFRETTGSRFMRRVIESIWGDFGQRAKQALLESDDPSAACVHEFAAMVVKALKDNREATDELARLLALTLRAEASHTTPHTAFHGQEVTEDSVDRSAPIPADDSQEVEVVRVSPMAYLKSMLAIAWACFRHPFSTTRIDLATGKLIPVERST